MALFRNVSFVLHENHNPQLVRVLPTWNSMQNCSQLQNQRVGVKVVGENALARLVGHLCGHLDRVKVDAPLFRLVKPALVLAWNVQPGEPLGHGQVAVQQRQIFQCPHPAAQVDVRLLVARVRWQPVDINVDLFAEFGRLGLEFHVSGQLFIIGQVVEAKNRDIGLHSTEPRPEKHVANPPRERWRDCDLHKRLDLGHVAQLDPRGPVSSQICQSVLEALGHNHVPENDLRPPILDVVLAQFQEVLAHLVVDQRLRHVPPLFWWGNVVDEQDQRHEHHDDEGGRNSVHYEHGCSRRDGAHQRGAGAKILEAGTEIGRRPEFQQETRNVGDDECHEECHGDQRGDLVDVCKQEQLAQKPCEQDTVDGVVSSTAKYSETGQDLVDCNGLEQFRGPHYTHNHGKHRRGHFSDNNHQETGGVQKLVPVADRQQFPDDTRFGVEIVQKRFYQTGHVQRCVQRLADVENDTDGASKLNSQASAYHEVGTSSLDGSVRCDSADRQRGEQVDSVAHHQQQQRAQDPHLAQDKAKPQEHQD
ncbi:hypothetical protein OGAPHI_000707 [Ogataea philodendri]|uniref:Uncharacterized protein n=1 Tax=Ogataea philodendri TaxID=1378263 RepID=A0A9P8T9L4_9ASCO|nr:uncharacterized protein OGAPHI_000707 [Ogataea philodendri]KAH3670996.1 hypothetical protein OGAPHI_000707 [Ogataea philodendri]